MAYKPLLNEIINTYLTSLKQSDGPRDAQKKKKCWRQAHMMIVTQEKRKQLKTLGLLKEGEYIPNAWPGVADALGLKNPWADIVEEESEKIYRRKLEKPEQLLKLSERQLIQIWEECMSDPPTLKGEAE